MNTVRYFGQEVNPLAYRKGFGFRGWLICILNTVRKWLEKKIVFYILAVETAKLKASQRRRVHKEARQFLNSDTNTVIVSKTSDFSKWASGVFNATGTDEQPTLARSKRYKESRHNTDEMLVVDGKPVPLVDGLASTAAAALRGQDRHMRYFHSRRNMHVYNIDGDFDPVPAIPKDIIPLISMRKKQ